MLGCLPIIYREDGCLELIGPLSCIDLVWVGRHAYKAASMNMKNDVLNAIRFTFKYASYFVEDGGWCMNITFQFEGGVDAYRYSVLGVFVHQSSIFITMGNSHFFLQMLCIQFAIIVIENIGEWWDIFVRKEVHDSWDIDSFRVFDGGENYIKHMFCEALVSKIPYLT
jgi:hypothetical protein